MNLTSLLNQKNKKCKSLLFVLLTLPDLFESIVENSLPHIRLNHPPKLLTSSMVVDRRKFFKLQFQDLFDLAVVCFYLVWILLKHISIVKPNHLTSFFVCEQSLPTRDPHLSPVIILHHSLLAYILNLYILFHRVVFMLIFLILAHIALIHIFPLEFRVECVDSLKIQVILVVN